MQYCNIVMSCLCLLQLNHSLSLSFVVFAFCCLCLSESLSFVVFFMVHKNFQMKTFKISYQGFFLPALSTPGLTEPHLL